MPCTMERITLGQLDAEVAAWRCGMPADNPPCSNHMVGDFLREGHSGAGRDCPAPLDERRTHGLVAGTHRTGLLEPPLRGDLRTPRRTSRGVLGGSTLRGRSAVIAACEQTSAELSGVTTEFRKFNVVVGSEAVAVDSLATTSTPTSRPRRRLVRPLPVRGRRAGLDRLLPRWRSTPAELNWSFRLRTGSGRRTSHAPRSNPAHATEVAVTATADALGRTAAGLPPSSPRCALGRCPAPRAARSAALAVEGVGGRRVPPPEVRRAT